jgi:spoIIIJ-associated protein
MANEEKIAKARKISELLNQVIKLGDFRLKYKIMVDPPVSNDGEWEKPEILVDLSGSDSPLLLERGGELLRALECVVLESLRLTEVHDRVVFDCMNFRSMRQQELRMAAEVAAQKVRDNGMPYPFAPMSSRERRMVHLALKEEADLRTESEGEGPARHLVVYPRDYKGKAAAAPPVRRRR